MKIVIAPDSFKESMSAKEAACAILNAIHKYDSHIETCLCPLADGGEGTLETLIYAMKGKIEHYCVKGPLFQNIEAPIGYVGSLAIIECAKVCGLELLSESQKDPYQTTTYGLGQLILYAVDHGASKIMICLGGSATNDGGIGMLSALGIRFQNSLHQDVTLTMKGLKDISAIDETHLDERLKNIEIVGVCDVDNPLCGDLGASAIYGPQKGLKKEDIMTIDNDMAHYAMLADQLHKCAYKDFKGAGAAGGLGYALIAFLHAKLQPGFDVVSEALDLENKIVDSDYVIVGEGKIDKQTQYGKTPYGVLKIAKKYHKKVYAFAGCVEDLDILKELGFSNVYAISPKDMELSVALLKGKENLENCVFQHMKVIVDGI